jgi:hypothetical protein
MEAGTKGSWPKARFLLVNYDEWIPQQEDYVKNHWVSPALQMCFFPLFGVVLIFFINFFLALHMRSSVFLVFSLLHQFLPQNSFSIFPRFSFLPVKRMMPGRICNH